MILRQDDGIGDLGERTDRDVQEPAEFTITSLGCPLGDVRRDGESCTPQLRSQTVALGGREVVRGAIDGKRQLMGGLPGRKSLIGHHGHSIGRTAVVR